MQRILPLLSVCALLCAALSAQNFVYHDDASPTVGAGNAFPFGAEGVRTQQLIPGSVLGSAPAVINDLLVNPRYGGPLGITNSQVHYGDFEIRMGTTQATTLSSVWANNTSNSVTVYRGPLLVHFVMSQWVPLGLPNAYQWSPQSPSDNLVIDFICWDVIDTGAVPVNSFGHFLSMRRSASDTIERAYRRSWTTQQSSNATWVDGFGIKLGFLLDDGNFVTHQGTCAGSSGLVPEIAVPPGTWPMAGSTLDVSLANGPASSFASLALGFEADSYLGFSLPLDMGLLGAPGCTFWQGWEVLLAPVATDAAGAAITTLQFPASVPSQLRLYTTWVCLDAAANSFGVVPSGFATLMF